jgi:hypothetical protein
MRLVGGVSLIIHGVAKVQTGPMIVGALAITAGLLFLAGLWTPAAGSLVAILGVWKTISQPGEPVGLHLVGNNWDSLGAAGPWRLVNGCAALWMEANRRSRSEELA